MQAKSKRFVVFFEYVLTLHMAPKHQPDDQQTGVEGGEESEPVLSTGRARRKHRIAHTTTGAAQPGTIVGTVYTTGSTTTRRQAPTHPLFSTNARSTRQTYVIFGICDTLCAYLRKYTICKKNSPLSSAACAWHSTSTPSSSSGVPALAVCCCTPPPPPPLSSFY